MKYNFRVDNRDETAAFSFYIWFVLLAKMFENLSIFWPFFAISTLGVKNVSYIHSLELDLKEKKYIYIRKRQVKYIYRSRFENIDTEMLHQFQQDHKKLITLNNLK